MIERKFVSEKMREFLVNQYLLKQLGSGKYSSFEIKRTPLGERIVIYTARPGLIVGKGGENIKELTKVFKSKFKMENPQIEIGEIASPMLDANYVADKITSTLVRFGSKRFKSIGYKTLQDILDHGALGAEIVISGKVPSARARSWRFKAGHLKKSGDISANKVKRAIATANLKSGTIGVKVSIMTPDIVMPDRIYIIDKKAELLEKKEPAPKVEIKDIIPKEEAIVVEEVKEKKERKPRAKKVKEEKVENENKWIKRNEGTRFEN